MYFSTILYKLKKWKILNTLCTVCATSFGCPNGDLLLMLKKKNTTATMALLDAHMHFAQMCPPGRDQTKHRESAKTPRPDLVGGCTLFSTHRQNLNQAFFTPWSNSMHLLTKSSHLLCYFLTQARQSCFCSWQFLLRTISNWLITEKHQHTLPLFYNCHCLRRKQVQTTTVCFGSWMSWLLPLPVPPLLRTPRPAKIGSASDQSRGIKTALCSSYVLFLRRGMLTWECQAALYWTQITSLCFPFFVCFPVPFRTARVSGQLVPFPSIHTALTSILWFLPLSDVHCIQCPL